MVIYTTEELGCMRFLCTGEVFDLDVASRQLIKKR